MTVKTKKKSKKKQSTTVKTKHGSASAPLATSTACSVAPYGKYVAGDYQAQYHNFLKLQKEQGCKHKEALRLWKCSDLRAALIADVSPAERKRRRFV